eukprot:CAMPEP_0113587206 /NCGR_PEP_ID=MMETSP0015_2-20120614/34758_1 /TAXON_ID=2838 /ORGANISM="Odontella" /LENGTH=138 /DNA_ID=CAMNT_0000492797 /DNA_START=479 /DNA_END=897 /DNA_ORIENTATION=+ /assembly_acc=CAM_ASM_000160
MSVKILDPAIPLIPAWLSVIIYGTVLDDASVPGEMVHGGFQNLAADVVEEDDDATRTQFAESFFDTFVLVVNGGVELQLLREPFALLWTTRNDDHSAALDICDLSTTDPVAPTAPLTMTVLHGFGVNVEHTKKRGGAG